MVDEYESSGIILIDEARPVAERIENLRWIRTAMTPRDTKTSYWLQTSSSSPLPKKALPWNA